MVWTRFIYVEEARKCKETWQKIHFKMNQEKMYVFQHLYKDDTNHYAGKTNGIIGGGRMYEIKDTKACPASKNMF